MTEHAHRVGPILPRRPMLALKAVRNTRRQVGAVDKEKRAADVSGTDLQRVKGAHLGVLVRPPRGSNSDRPIIAVIAAWIIDEMVKTGAAREAELTGQRQLPIQLDSVLKPAVRNCGQDRL